MALVTPDFTESQDPIEAGEYTMRVTGVEEKTSQAGAKYLSWTLETFNEQDPKNNGRKHWHITMLEGRGAGMLKQFYTACTNEALEGAFDTEQLIGRELAVVINVDDEGRARTKAVKPIQ